MHRTTLFASLTVLLLIVGCAQEPEPVVEIPESPPAAPVRHIDLEGQPNFRDLGGYETVDGRTVVWGQVYRSGELPRLSDGDVAKLDAFYILDASYIDAALEQAVADCGSMEAYIRDGLGITDEELERLRSQLLE